MYLSARLLSVCRVWEESYLLQPCKTSSLGGWCVYQLKCYFITKDVKYGVTYFDKWFNRALLNVCLLILFPLCVVKPSQ